MAARRGRLAKPDSQGQYVRQLGRKLGSGGKRVQHKFRLGCDKHSAERRDHQLRQMWEQIEKDSGTGESLWNEATLDIAKQVARGADRIILSPVEHDESPRDYARRLQATQDRFPFLRFAASDQQRYAEGLGDRAYDLREVVVMENPYDNFWKQKEVSDLLQAPPMRPQHDATAVANDPAAQMLSAPYRSTLQAADEGATLHQAFDAYGVWIKGHYFDVGRDGITDHGYTKLGQLETLKSRHDDTALSKIDYEYIERMYRYWRQRPLKNSPREKQERISRASVHNYIGELHRFFKWLHRSGEFAWRKPEDFDEIDRSVPPDAETVKKQIRNVETFRLEELQLLNRYARPTERLYLMLGLNCGFGAKEIATLTIGEVFLHQALSEEEQELFGFPSTADDSFVSLVRNKTTIVGKYLLFDQTTKMLEWIWARRLKQPNPTPDQRLILNTKGRPLDQRSPKGNPSRQIPNSFVRLKERIRNDGNAIHDLPFKCLRKTAGDLVRRFSDGEVAGVFLLHGQPVKTDKLSEVYTNRPFGKVYEAIRRMEKHLAPVFAEVGDDPTLQQARTHTSRKAVDKIAEMDRQGSSVREIAEATGKSKTTIHRHLQNLRESSKADG